MATTIDHEKPEGVDEPPAVKKVRLDEDAKVEAKVAEDVKKVKIDEGAASEAETRSPAQGQQADSTENADTNGDAKPSAPNGEEASPTASNETEEKEAGKPNVIGSAFGGFAAFSGSSGFGSFSTPSSTTGFGAFASSSSSTSGFGASTTSSGFGTTFLAPASTSASSSPVSSSSAAESKSADETSEASKESDKPSGFGGFATFQNTSTFSSIASTTTATDGFGTTTFSSDLSEIDAAAAAEKKPEVIVPALTEAELANGEEGETILVEKRAKLYKLVDGDYAEVGIGPLRVLRTNDADAADKSAVRFVMRRESYARGPGTKLLVNASLASCLGCVKKTEKALLVTVLEPAAEQDKEFAPITYLLRFGAPEDLDAVHARLARYISAAK